MRTCLLLASALFSTFLFGQSYFQQDVDYRIDVQLDDVNHFLSGQLELDYTNNSPDLLDTIWMHIWPNAYKDNSTALAHQFLRDGNVRFYYADDEQRGYIDSLAFKVDGQSVIWKLDKQHIDICFLVLNSPLQPGGTITIATPFKVKLPDGSFSRLGHVGESYMITQWYPKPAVYDADGWHAMPYLNQGEFYSEFGTYDVSITLPKNYKLAATGDRQDAIREEYNLMELDRRTREKFTPEAFEEGITGGLSFPASSDTLKTVRFYQENVHDFAWFADKRWNALTDTVTLPYSGRVVQLWAFFTNYEPELWINSMEYMRDAVYYYSLWNGEYPYNHCTAVDGTIAAGGGMEYPNITVIGLSGDALSLEVVIMHEIGHNWFYGILGSNERDHAWMDEGINSYNEMRYLRTKYPDTNMFASYLGLDDKLLEFARLDGKGPDFFYKAGYELNASRGYDQPNDHPSAEYTSINYGTMVYMKTAVVFDQLAQYLGQDVFDDCMQNYYNQWKFSHPGPDDMQVVFETVTRQDLSWFFDEVLTTTVHLEDVEQFNYAPDQKRSLNFKFLGGWKEDDKNSIYWSPILGYNAHNGSMAGLAIYNGLIPYRDIEYLVAPMYSLGSGSIAGGGYLAYNWKGPFQAARVSYNWSSYDILAAEDPFERSWYGKGELRLSIHAKDKDLSDNKDTYFDFYLTNVEERFDDDALRGESLFGMGFKDSRKYMGLSHRFVNGHVLRPFSYRIDMEVGYPIEELVPAQMGPSQPAWADGFVRVSAEANAGIMYSSMRKYFNFRLFAGYFLSNNTTSSRYNWHMDGQSGPDDYRYTQVFMGRNRQTPDVLSLQRMQNHGGFKTPMLSGHSNDWLVAFNMDVDMPIPPPLSVFIDLGFYPFKLNGEPQTGTLYDAGISVKLLGGNFRLNLPLFYSQDIKDEYETRDISFGERISFNLNLNIFQPLTVISRIPY